MQRRGGGSVLLGFRGRGEAASVWRLGRVLKGCGRLGVLILCERGQR